jgi:acyl carrier protein
MNHRNLAGIVLLILAAGCFDSSQKNTAPVKAPLDVEKAVREVIAKHLNVKPEAIDMRRPLTDLKADDLDIVEIVMTLEERLEVAIPDSVLDKHGGLLPKNGPSRITAADLVAAAEESLSTPTPRRKR